MKKLLLVTGGTRGIGRAIADRFAREGFDLAVGARKPGDLTAMKQDLEARIEGIEVLIRPADLSQNTEVSAFVGWINGLGRPVDVLVNNAGIFYPGSILDEASGNLEKMMDLNLYSAYHITRGIVPGMVERKKGHIFNMCSIASIKAYPNGGSYAISKFALLGFSKVLREELKQSGIRVTAVLPGATLTDSWAEAGLPDERFIRAEDVADAVFSAHALSERSVVEELLIRPQLGDI